MAIDDTPANLFVLASALAKDFEFQLANSGSSGLQLAEKAPPDLILLDVMMPEMDGFETCRRIKDNPDLKDVPIIFVTALHDVTNEVTGLTLMADDYLHKPVSVEIARQRILNLLNRSEMRRTILRQRDELEFRVEERTSELRKINADLLIANDKAAEAERTKSLLLANMSHELRTPLNIIIGKNTLLAAHLSDPNLIEKSKSIGEAAQLLNDIVTDLLTIARVDAFLDEDGSKDFELAALLKKVLSPLSIAAERKGLRVRSQIQPELPTRFTGLAVPIGHILKSLVSNSVKFSSRGNIDIRVSGVSRDTQSINLRFEVQDEGIGIDQQYHDQIFSNFRQVDDSLTRRHGGLGIGLAVSRQLIEVLGGTIGFASQPGKGSTFYFEVPLGLVENSNVENSACDPALSDSDNPSAAPREVCENLLKLLEEDDFRAYTEWKEIRTSLSCALGERFSHFSEAMETMELQEAANLLRAAMT